MRLSPHLLLMAAVRQVAEPSARSVTVAEDSRSSVTAEPPALPRMYRMYSMSRWCAIVITLDRMAKWTMPHPQRIVLKFRQRPCPWWPEAASVTAARFKPASAAFDDCSFRFTNMFDYGFEEAYAP